jgi:hypothetical protein
VFSGSDAQALTFSADRNSHLSKSDLFGIGATDSRLLLPSYFRWAAAANDTMSAFLENRSRRHVVTYNTLPSDFR